VRRFALALAAALLLPAAAHAKGPTSLAVCGADGCRDAGSSDSGEVFDISRSADAPPPGPYYELRLTFEHGEQSKGIYYEPRSGLVSYSESFSVQKFAPLVPAVATAVKEAANHVEAYPTPRLTSVSVGDRPVRGDTSSYLALFGVKGPFVVPGPRAELEWIRFDSPDPNPWTATPLAFYPQDGVLLTGSTYVKLPAATAADIVAAGPLGDGPGGGTHVPWIPIAVAAAGVLILLVLALRRASAREVAPVH
jgi:hypothetical protein